ncbi:MAG: AAA family ATPase [Sandaracinaceae bacterium]|nr:AAA family ATPase [Sandaracinaceae bacterium]
MIERNLGPVLLESARYYPVVTLTGPRQSGKTTLCRALFPDKPYVTLEALDVREYARTDPRAFLAEHAGGAVLDEVQHVPELTSWIQVVVDEDPRPGRFVLTGSQHFGLSDAIAQSLAGRTAVHHLLPPSLDELRRFERAPTTLLETLFTGAYPRIHDRGIPAERWLSDYLTTYVQRDVRQVLNVADLSAFTTFLRLAAGRTARELNLSALGADAGVSHNTARSWLSVLETSWLCHRLPPLFRNLRKQPREGAQAALPRQRPRVSPARCAGAGAAPSPPAARRGVRELGGVGDPQVEGAPRARRRPPPLSADARARSGRRGGGRALSLARGGQERRDHRAGARRAAAGALGAARAGRGAPAGGGPRPRGPSARGAHGRHAAAVVGDARSLLGLIAGLPRRPAPDPGALRERRS